MAKELYVGSISKNATEEDLRKLFSVIGTVTSIHLITDPETGQFKGCGYVRMSTLKETSEAVESLDGALLVDEIITVSIARPQVQKPRRFGAGRGNFGGGGRSGGFGGKSGGFGGKAGAAGGKAGGFGNKEGGTDNKSGGFGNKTGGSGGKAGGFGGKAGGFAGKSGGAGGKFGGSSVKSGQDSRPGKRRK